MMRPDLRALRYSHRAIKGHLTSEESLDLPLIPRKMLNTVVFIYPDKRSARHDMNFCATGFVVAVPSLVAPRYHFYVVTNYHVLRELTDPVLRFNRKDMPNDSVYFKAPRKFWRTDRKHDIAALNFSFSSQIDFSFVPMVDPTSQRPRLHRHWRSESHVSLTQVTPSWDIAALLNRKWFAKRRESGDKKAAREPVPLPDFQPDSKQLTYGSRSFRRQIKSPDWHRGLRTI